MSNELYHYGVKGMHWGVRRYQPYPKGYKGSGKYVGRIGSLNQTDILRSSDGKTVMTPRKKGLIARGLAKVSPKIAKAQKNFYSYDIRDDKNNKVGYAELERQKNGKVLYGNWINVDKKHRGKGHAQRAMDMLIKEGKKDKYERFDLEVPGDSKDARHIYEKYGFKAGKKISDDDIWGGLTKMSRPLAKKGKIGGGSKVDKMTADEKNRKKRRNRLILAGAGILAGGAAYAIGRKMLKKGNVAREKLARKKLGEALDDAQWYREDAINDPNSILAPFNRRRAILKKHQADRYENLANKYIDARLNGKMIKNVGRNLLLTSAGSLVARELLDTNNEKKKRSKRK